VTPAGGAFTSLSCALLNATAALSTLKVTDLNADLLDGTDWRAPGPIGAVTPGSVAATTLSSTGLATLQSARVTSLAPSSFVMTDGSSNLTTGSASETNVTYTFFQDAATIDAGNAMFFAISASVWYGMMFYQFPPAINDSFSQRFTMAAGSYILYCEGYAFTNRGISTWYIDGVLQGTLGWYAGVGANIILGLAVTVVGSGVHTLKCVTATKHPSSTDYYMSINKYWIR
jgi:hypothetical protein